MNLIYNVFRKSLIIVSILFFSISLYGKIIVKADWGKEKGEFLFYNLNSQKNINLVSIGPTAIKVLKRNKIAVLDSLKGAINIFSAKGKFLKEVDIGEVKKKKGIIGFEIDPENGDIYILGENIIYRKKGKKIECWFGTGKKNSDQFVQPFDIRIFGDFIAVGDLYKEKLIIINKKTKKKVFSIDWMQTGYAFDQKGNLFFLRYSSGDGYSLWRINVKSKVNKPVFVSFLGFSENQSGMLCGVSMGKLLLKYPDKKGDIKIVVTHYDGRRIFSKIIRQSTVMGQQFNFNKGKIYSLEYNSKLAPDGNGVIIKTYKTGKKFFFSVKKINKISKSVDLGKKINCLRIFENILYGLSNGIIYKIVENKLIKVLSVEKYRDKIIDFYKSGEDWYILTNIENGKVFKLNSNSDVLLSFPDFVEESPLFKFPGMLFLSNENKMICVQDYYFGRAVCIDYENGIVKSVISDRSNGILIPELFFITCSFNSKQYFINICDANGNTYDKKGPFELENSISIVRLFHKVSKNGDFMIYLEDVSGNGYIETYDSQANLINRISKTISISVIRDRKFDFDSKALYFIRGKSKLVTIDLF